MYFTAKSCIHATRALEPDQNMPYLPPYHRPEPNFHENIDIMLKLANSAAQLKILSSAENCGVVLVI